MIKFPVRVKKGEDARFAYIVDSAGRILFGGGSLEDAEQLVAAANAGAKLQHAQPLEKQPRRKNAKQRIAEEYRESDILAKEMDRRDIVYGHYDDLPQAGENVARLGKTSRNG